ncbi:MAG TPA: ParB/RepB/Spo0J family partition protein [Xanthobacteraceae bacterium]|nr:ParB/RepB/Spo0J family partition protein [Xanthobacteraceae bacterium]
MAEESHRSRLGRGLASLIGDAGAEPAAPERGGGRGHRRVSIAFLRPNPRNPRKVFSDAEIVELAGSIRERGIIQPIVVRTVHGGATEQFEIIAGERRWRAAQRAGLHEVPIIVHEASDSEALELAIIENVQRADLNPLEEGMGYQALADEYKYSHDEIAKIVGKSRSHVANTLRLLKLPETVKVYINAGKLSAGHARALVGLPDPESIAREIVERGLNVRDVEGLAQQRAREAGKPKKQHKRAAKDIDTLALEKRLSDALGLKVTINGHGEKGVVLIQYRDLDQLDEVIRRLETS